jgi:hypothetical protein
LLLVRIKRHEELSANSSKSQGSRFIALSPGTRNAVNAIISHS